MGSFERWLIATTLVLSPAAAFSVEPADLFMKEMQFLETTRRDVRILVFNGGGTKSEPTVVRLVLRLGAQPKSVEMKLPVIPPGKGLWVLLSAGPILPPKTPLKSVPLSIEIDPGKKVKDKDRSNNDTFHNPR